MSSQAGTRQWLSFHLFLCSHFDEFLVDHLAPALEERTAPGSPSRFFFIRYGDGGTHLRLRFLLRSKGFESPLLTWLERIVGQCTSGMSGTRLQACSYDRATLYFGETVESVYSELLNEQTSWLAIYVMRVARNRRAKSYSLLAAIVNSTLGFVGLDSRYAIVRRWKAFATDELRKVGVLTESFPSAMKSILPAYIQQLSSSIYDETAVQTRICRTAALIRRSLRIPKGMFVATHALHLFCNKVGLSFQHEFWIAEALDKLSDEKRCYGETNG